MPGCQPAYGSGDHLWRLTIGQLLSIIYCQLKEAWMPFLFAYADCVEFILTVVSLQGNCVLLSEAVASYFMDGSYKNRVAPKRSA